MKKLFFLLIIISLSKLLVSQEIDTIYAQEIATNFIKNLTPDSTKDLSIKNINIRTYNKHKTTIIVNFNTSGFVIMSAYKCYKPILAYSSTNIFPFDNTPIEIETWLKQYDYIIDYNYKNTPNNSRYLYLWINLEKNSKTAKANDFILLQSTWGQSVNNTGSSPCGNSKDPDYGAYNKFIEGNIGCACNHCSAGCTGIATAQILNYWKYPAYTDKRQYDWNNIENYLFEFSSFDEIDATAHLIADCAEYLNSNYCSNGCSTSSDLLKARNSLVRDFNYSKKADLRKRTGTDKWKERILDDLEQGFPILYGAAENTWGNGAHAFVCDGYDYVNDLFHFNFGWRGLGDGFYDIDDLFVTNQLTGDTIANFDIWHWAIFNIYPEYYYGCSEVVDLGEWYSENEDYLPLIDQPWAGTVLTPSYDYPASFRTVNNGDVVNMHAYKSIVLRSGFCVKQGGKFHAYLTDCPQQKNTINKSQINNTDSIIVVSTVKLTIFPNPVKTTAQLFYFLPQETNYSIDIYDIFGKKIKQVEQGYKTKGNYQAYINLSDLQNGIYFCTLKTSQNVVSKKIIKI